MANRRRSIIAVLFSVLLAYDPSLFALVAADPDVPGPSPNLEEIRSCSLIIPMSSTLQGVGTSSTFNVKTYGLINHLLWNDITVKWAIRAGKKYREADFSAIVEQIDVTNNATLGRNITVAANTTFIASAFIIPVTLTPFALPLILAYNQRHPASPVKVYRLKETLTGSRRVDIRYTLKKKPFIAPLNSSENAWIQIKYLEGAGFINGTHFRLMSKEEANALNSDVCVSMCTEPHFEGPFTETAPAPSFVSAMHEFVNSGGNFLAQCGGIWTYENCLTKFDVDNKGNPTSYVDCPPGHFVTTNGLFLKDNSLSKPNPMVPIHHVPDLAFSQYDETWDQWVGGSVPVIGLNYHPLGWSQLKPNAYIGVQLTDGGSWNKSTFHSVGVKVFPGQVGHNVWYITGHDVEGFMPSLRQYLNAALVPAQRDVSCGLDVDECAWGGCGGYVKRSVEGVSADIIPCDCDRTCDTTGKCGGVTDPFCPIPGSSPPPRAPPAPRAAPAPKAAGAPTSAGTPGGQVGSPSSGNTGAPVANSVPSADSPLNSAPALPPGLPYIDVNSTQGTTIEQSVEDGFRYFVFVISKDVASLQIYVEVLNWDESVTVDIYLKRSHLPTQNEHDCVIRNVRNTLFDYRNAQPYCPLGVPPLEGEWVVGVYSHKQTGFAFEGFLEPNYGRVTEETITIGSSSSIRPSSMLTLLAAVLAAFLSNGKDRILIAAVATLLVISLGTGVNAQGCDAFNSCDTCLYNSLECGWCGLTGTCHYGNTTGPLNGTCADLRTWEYTISRVISATGTDGVISPTNVEVFLRPGKNVTFPVSITIPFLPPLDFFFLIDASESMRNDIEAVRASTNNLVMRLKELQNNTVFGLGSFIEKPQMPFCGWPECYSYKQHAPLDANITKFEAALDDLLGGLRRNNEHPESSLDGMLYSALDSTIGFREGSFKIVMVITDAASHVAGDGPRILGIHTPNNVDGIQDGYPPGSAEDYVSIAGLRQVLISRDVNPIWAAIDIIQATLPIYNYYKNITAQLGFGSTVQVSLDSSNIIDAIINGTNDLLSKVVLAADVDPRVIIKRINPSIYNNATRLSTVTFNVTVMADEGALWIGSTVNATAKYVGFGNSVHIMARTAVACRGCDPNDPSKRLDRCGVCGGNNTCIGCDGILFSEVVFDACGVCGGDNSTCRDCMGVINGPAEFDVCGVCGGNGSFCAGCDGVPLSGAVINECGECNGPPNCQAVRGAIIGLSTLAALAVVAAVAAAIFLGVGAAKMAAADTILFTQLNSLKDNPLYKHAQNVKDNPFYKNKL